MESLIQSQASNQVVQKTSKESLLSAKNHIEHELRRLEVKDVNVTLAETLARVKYLNETIARMQHDLNELWKQTEHLNEALVSLHTRTS